MVRNDGLCYEYTRRLIGRSMARTKKSVLLGGVLIILGQFTLAIESITAFYTGLALIISGVGALKPNISTMVGGLYKKEMHAGTLGLRSFILGSILGHFRLHCSWVTMVKS